LPSRIVPELPVGVELFFVWDLREERHSNLKMMTVASRLTSSIPSQPTSMICKISSSRISTSRRDLPARTKPEFCPWNCVTTTALRTPGCGCQVILSSPCCLT
jgi:hypothetical protein